MTVNRQIKKDEIYENIKTHFPSFIPPYWIKKAVDYYAWYYATLLINNFHTKQQKVFPEYVTTLERIISDLERLQENRFGYQFVINYLNSRLKQERWFSIQYQESYKNLKITQKSNRSKSVYEKDTFLANLYLSIVRKYCNEKATFPRNAFIRFAYEIMYYFEMIDNFCYERIDNDGKVKITRFIWYNGKKVFFDTDSKKSNKRKLFNCAYFDNDKNICRRLTYRKAVLSLCDRKDVHNNEITYSYVENKLKSILKNLKKEPHYYTLDNINDSFWNRYMHEQQKNQKR
jgi:hypothetical protein